MSRGQIMIECKHCDGHGYVPLSANLLMVYRLVKRKEVTPWHSLGEVRAALANKGVHWSAASISMKLAKLVEHGLLERVETKPICWRAK